MRHLTPQRRAAVLAASCCAIIPSFALLMVQSHSPAVHIICGLFIGIALAITLGTLIRSRRSCA